MWQERKFAAKDETSNHLSSSSCLHNDGKLSLGLPFPAYSIPKRKNPRLASSGIFDNDDLVADMVSPPLTVVLEGRSICHRISLHKHDSYESLAVALRQMFVDYDSNGTGVNVDLPNAVPGHLIAYEDMENDLLLVGDLKWKDFVRVAKRIRILPAKAESRKQRHK